MLLFCLVMTQPEFVINERTMGVMGTDSKGNPKYFEKASFSITLLKHVEAAGQDRTIKYTLLTFGVFPYYLGNVSSGHRK